MKQQVLVIHGGWPFIADEQYYAYLKSRTITLDDLRPRAEWKKKLSEDLGKDFDVLLPSMPNKFAALYRDWSLWFVKILPLLNDGVILVGHSLGGLFLVKYFSENIVSKKIKALIVVASPFGDNDPDLASFNFTSSFNQLEDQINALHLVYSEDDDVVPIERAQKYQEVLPSAQLHRLNGYKHFNSQSVPEIVELIKSLT